MGKPIILIGLWYKVSHEKAVMSFKPLTDQEILDGVRDLVARGKIGWTDHVEDQMTARGYHRGQIKACLARGGFTERPTIPNRSGPIQYAFRVEASVDGERIAVAASLIPEKRVVVITVFDAI
jgi:hypothetical protein